MKSIVKLAVFFAILWVAFQYAKPYIDRLTGTLGVGDLGGGGSTEMRCISVAERTTETFAEMVRDRAMPPVDINRWSGSYRLAEGRLRDAELNCQCDGEICDMGIEALGLLAGHMTKWDDAVHQKQPVLNGGRELGRIYDLLNSAERKASR